MPVRQSFYLGPAWQLEEHCIQVLDGCLELPETSIGLSTVDFQSQVAGLWNKYFIKVDGFERIIVQSTKCIMLDLITAPVIPVDNYQTKGCEPSTVQVQPNYTLNFMQSSMKSL